MVDLTDAYAQLAAAMTAGDQAGVWQALETANADLDAAYAALPSGSAKSALQRARAVLVGYLSSGSPPNCEPLGQFQSIDLSALQGQVGSVLDQVSGQELVPEPTANPWPWLAVGAVSVVGIAVAALSRKRKR